MAIGRMYPSTRLEKPTGPITRGTVTPVVSPTRCVIVFSPSHWRQDLLRDFSDFGPDTTDGTSCRAGPAPVRYLGSAANKGIWRSVRCW